MRVNNWARKAAHTCSFPILLMFSAIVPALPFPGNLMFAPHTSPRSYTTCWKLQPRGKLACVHPMYLGFLVPRSGRVHLVSPLLPPTYNE